MSDQMNPTETTEDNAQSAETLQAEFAQQGETVEEPQEGQFEPSNGALVEPVAPEAISEEPASNENGVSAEATADENAEENTEENTEAEEAMTQSLAEQGETVAESNTFVAGPESMTVADGEATASESPANDAAASTAVATDSADQDASADQNASTDQNASADQDASADQNASAEPEAGSRSVKVERTNGPAMFELPERMARNRRIYDAKIEDIHYKNIPMLVRFLDTYGRILSRRRTGVSAKMQRRMVQAVKRARELSLLPYTNEHNRLSRKNR